MGWLKTRLWARRRRRQKKIAKTALQPPQNDRDHWIELRQMFTEEEGMTAFFGGEYDKLRAREDIASVRIDLFTLTVETRKLFATVFDKTCDKYKKLYIGVFRLVFWVEPGMTVMGLTNRPRATLRPIECLESGRHDGTNRTMYVVGGDSTGGFCFGNSGGNAFLIEQIAQGEFFTAITFMVSRLAHINEDGYPAALREYRQVLPSGTLAPARSPSFHGMMSLSEYDDEPRGDEP